VSIGTRDGMVTAHQESRECRELSRRCSCNAQCPECPWTQLRRSQGPPDGSVALVPHLQARLLARSLRGDLDAYVNLGDPGFIVFLAK
jgi:hypothetical protein